MKKYKKEMNVSREEQQLNKIIRIYEDMINTTPSDKEYRQKLANSLLSLQTENGSWSLIGNELCDSDIMVAYTFFPTYYATAALICLEKSDGHNPAFANALERGLDVAMVRRLAGSGFDATAQCLQALAIFKKAGLYEWIAADQNKDSAFAKMIGDIVEGFREGLKTGRIYSDWNVNFEKEFTKEVEDFDAALCKEVWYACYGSNISEERFMRYINSCTDQRRPAESRAFRFDHDIYFAYQSRNWERKGVAFLDHTKPGKALGRIYKITNKQFAEIQKMEGGNYSHKMYLGKIDGLPVYTFTSPEKRTDLKCPSKAYADTILTGLKETYPEKSELFLKTYLYRANLLGKDEVAVLDYVFNSAHGVSLGEMATNPDLPAKTRIQKSVKILKEYELIKQDARSVAAGHALTDPEAVVYTVKKNRELIDFVLL